MTRTAKIWLIVVLVVAVLALCCVVSVAAAVFLAGVFNIDEITEVARAPGSPNVTLANYGRIEMGMTYGEVVTIFGGPGVRTAQIQVGGEWLEFYSWKAAEGGTATVTFKNGVVSTKNENGLM